MYACFLGISIGLRSLNIYLNGELTIDFPEDVNIPIEPNQMATAVLSGNRIKFDYCGLDRAIALLREQYTIGTIEVKMVLKSGIRISILTK